MDAICYYRSNGNILIWGGFVCIQIALWSEKWDVILWWNVSWSMKEFLSSWEKHFPSEPSEHENC